MLQRRSTSFTRRLEASTYRVEASHTSSRSAIELEPHPPRPISTGRRQSRPFGKDSRRRPRLRRNAMHADRNAHSADTRLSGHHRRVRGDAWEALKGACHQLTPIRVGSRSLGPLRLAASTDCSSVHPRLRRDVLRPRWSSCRRAPGGSRCFTLLRRRRRARPACASSSSCRRARGNPRGHGRRGSRCGCSADSIVTTAWAIRLSNSSVSIRSVFQISERSVTWMSASARQTSWIRPWPSSSTSPVRKTAQSSCMACCISRRSSAVGVLPVGVAEAVEAGERLVGRRRLASVGVLLAGLDDLGAAQAGGAAEDHEVDQRVRAEPVGAVHRDAGRLADRHQARHDRVRVAVLRVTTSP